MKKGLIIVSAIILTAIAALYIIGKQTGALAMYSSPGGANEPAIKVGSHFWGSRLKEPKRFSFLIFEHNASLDGRPANSLVVSRICGIPGDKIRIRNGTLYVNGKNADEGINIFNEYIVKLPDEMQRTRQLAGDNPDIFTSVNYVAMDYKDSLIANLTTEYVHKNKLHCTRFINDLPNEMIEKQWGKAWTMDNFGPLTVPAGSFFVLGDNRHNALDSRFIGFIPASAFRGTVLFKD